VLHPSVWNALVSCVRQAREIQAARAEERRLRDELKRLLRLGDHLIRDIGLDPGRIRAWLKEDP
jgi:uncharacterized protein YjiS (DUF1127 family)